MSNQNWESLRMLENLVALNVKDYLGLPKQTEFLRDSKGDNVLYMNWTAADSQNDGDVAIFIRTASPLPDEVADAFLARSVTPNHVVPPSPIFEVWVQDDTSMLSGRSVLKDRVLFFLNNKAARNAVLNVVNGAHPELKGIFGAAADSAIAGVKSYAASATGMVGGN